MSNIIAALEKANMMLMGYGANNTVFLTDSVKKAQELEKQLTITQQALDTAVEALKFYADGDNYNREKYGISYSIIEKDYGTKAEAALAAIKE